MDRSIAQIPNESNEVKVTVTLVLNASFSWLEKPTKGVVTYHFIACIILSSLAITAITVNVFLLVTIIYSNSLKRVILNQLVFMVSLACVLDSIINMPISIYYIKNSGWLPGLKVCTLNAVSVLLVSFMITWNVCGMCVERWYSIFKRSKYRFSSVCKQVVVIVTPITISIASLFPVIVGLIEVRLFPNRFMCSIALKKEQCYRIIILLCFVLPVTLGLLALLSSLMRNFTNVRNISSHRGQLSYPELFFEETHLWNEWQSSKFVGVIMLLFLVLEFPFIINQMGFTSFPNLSLQPNSTLNDSSAFPLVQMTSSTSKAYSWCKFSFCLLFPITTLILRKDIRRKLNAMISFFKPNSSIPNKNETKTSVPVRGENPDDFLVPQVWRRRRLSSVTSLTTPLVFGKSKVANPQFQILDLSSGLAKWKAIYNESKKIERLPKKQGKTLFDDAFEDEDEVTEFERYEDGTEDEINSSEGYAEMAKVKEVAVQTHDKCFKGEKFQREMCHNSSHQLISVSFNMEQTNSFEKRKRKSRNRRLSKSFSANRTTNISSNRRNYMTYPKLPSNARIQTNYQANMTTSDLLKALKAYRSRKSTTACDIIPRGTAELMDTTLDCKDIVSL
ncbi:hypothetical protein HNY73_020498 [Argiope bruennichi]|uniref:G-protein coupled receptors family 1 profile domain-containing protein n=1 Tax=Argiope bruennichi TaxID=94029 RepID=A0A8T0E833_ARGBR|nr:hypothetical protein HNY73_020498 [Argiope bruennichi]